LDPPKWHLEYPYKCLGLSKRLAEKLTVSNRGSQRDVVYLGLPIAPSYMSLNAGDGVGWVCANGAQICKLWRSNSIFNTWIQTTNSKLVGFTKKISPKDVVFKKIVPIFYL
jgi:hypothetical protein